MDSSALARPGDVWKGARDFCAGRVIRITEAGDDGYVTYTVLAGKDGVQNSKERGRMSALSLRGAYARMPEEEAREFEPEVIPEENAPEKIPARLKRALRVIAGKE